MQKSRATLHKTAANDVKHHLGVYSQVGHDIVVCGAAGLVFVAHMFWGRVASFQLRCSANDMSRLSKHVV